MLHQLAIYDFVLVNGAMTGCSERILTLASVLLSRNLPARLISDQIQYSHRDDQ